MLEAEFPPSQVTMGQNIDILSFENTHSQASKRILSMTNQPQLLTIAIPHKPHICIYVCVVS